MRPRQTSPAGAPLLDVVVPARNEAARIEHGLATLSSRLARLDARSRIIVVDSASTDGTAAIVRRWSGPVPVTLLRCARPGKGAAVRRGLLATTAPYVGFCDADMATDVEIIEDVLAMLTDGTRVVVGSRRHPESDVEIYSHPLRRIGALVFNRLCRELTGGVVDTQCGFKFFDGPLAREAAANFDTFSAQVKKQLAWYFAPPSAPGSPWAQKLVKKKPKRQIILGKAAKAADCAGYNYLSDSPYAEGYKSPWVGIPTSDGHAIVWYQDGEAAAKKTADLIPLCHPLAISKISVDLKPNTKTHSIEVEATVKLTGQTGVEMEALTAVSVACLTLYDMAKAVDRGMRITDIRLTHKAGGKSGVFEGK